MIVHILGGGIGGMSCALHLARLAREGVLPADLKVTIYEKEPRLGGKASSQFEPRGNEGCWPGEHGFRFFPNFYRCIVDTLRHIPITRAQVERRGLKDAWIGKTVFDLLLQADAAGVARGGQLQQIDRAQSLPNFSRSVVATLGTFDVPVRDALVFARRILRFLTTCHERALVTWETKTLKEFIEENQFGPEMTAFLRSLRALSAMRADRGSLRTLLFTATQMLADFDPEYHLKDALLPGPTDYLMLEPWREALDNLGVTIKTGHAVMGLEFSGASPARLLRVKINDDWIEASPDQMFVLALPFEVARPFLVSAPNLPPALRPLGKIAQNPDNLGLGAEPMVGVQFWLRRDHQMVAGHVMYPGASWALTSVSQAQFWSRTFTRPLAQAFDAPGLQGILSTIVSAWDVKAERLGKAPAGCAKLELAKEVFQQLVEESGASMTWDDVIDFHVDTDVKFTPGQAFASTPLWVSPRGSYLQRPLPDPGCGNFFLASDWAQTETDVGSMESADEAARLAIRGIAKQIPGFVAFNRLPAVRRLRLWAPLEFARKIDKWLYDNSRSHGLDLSSSERLATIEEFARLRKTAQDALDTHPEKFADGLTSESLTEAIHYAYVARRNDLDDAVRFLRTLDEEDVESGDEREQRAALENVLSGLNELGRSSLN